MNKTRQKLSIVALLIAVIVCFTAAILGLTATPSAKVSADNISVSTITVDNAQVKNKGVQALSRLPISDGATKVFVEYTLGNDDGEGHSFMFGNSVNTAPVTLKAGTSIWNGKHHGFANGHIAAANNPALYTASYKITFDLTEKTIVWLRGSTEILSKTDVDYTDMVTFGFFTYTHKVGGSFTVKIYDDMGKDLGVTSYDFANMSIAGLPKVTFNADNGTSANVVEVKGATVSAPTAPTKDGYKFIGWFNGDVQYNFADEVVSDLTLTAKWVKNNIVTVNGEEGVNKYVEATSRLPRSTDATKIYIEYTLGNDDGAGHSFMFEKTTGTSVVVFTQDNLWTGAQHFGQANGHIPRAHNAVFYTASYKVIFDLVENTVLWYRGSTEVLNKSGVDFADGIAFGFYAGTTSGAGSFTISIYDDMGKDLGITSLNFKDTTIDLPKATFDVNYDGGKDVVLDVTQATISAPSVERAGYKFLGWFADAECTTELVIPAEVTGDFTAYAKWELNEFTVNFNTNGGTAVDAQTVIYNGKATVPVAPTMDGYYFDGWYADEDLTAKYDFDSAVTADITVYAKWISFDAYYANIVSTGAPSIKINEKTTSGIRFATAVNNDLLAQLTAEGYTYTVGTLIVPFDYVGANAPTMELLDSEGKGYYNIVSTFDGTTDVFYGTLQSLRESNYGRKWVGLGYVAIDMGDDGVKYIYSAFDQANALSIYDVAEGFYNEYKDVADEEENVEVAKYYIDSVVALDADYAVIDKVTDTEIPYEVAIVENVVTVTVKEGYDFVIKSVTVNGKIAKVEIAAGGKSATYQIA